MRNVRFLCRLAVFSAVVFLMCSVSVCAADSADLSVALKTMQLLTNKITGSAVMAIVYDPANANSKADAEAIKNAIGEGLDAPGGVKITSALVPLAEIGDKVPQAKLVWIARGGCTDAASAAAAAAGALSMTTDLDCVKAGKSVLGIVSKPGVEIYYSKTAADTAKVVFSQAFTMLVKQL